jgi:hypothetical protein
MCQQDQKIYCLCNEIIILIEFSIMTNLNEENEDLHKIKMLINKQLIVLKSFYLATILIICLSRLL